jgi:hypothetical protein
MVTFSPSVRLWGILCFQLCYYNQIYKSIGDANCVGHHLSIMENDELGFLPKGRTMVW